MPVKRLLFLICSALFLQTAVAQQKYWQHAGVEQGLPSGTINCFLRLHDGRLAMGSAEGLILYNGYSYSLLQPPAAEFSNPYITQLLQTPDHALWIGTREGLWKYIPDKGIWQTYSDTLFDNSGVQSLQFSAEKGLVYATSRSLRLIFHYQSPTLLPLKRIAYREGSYRYHVNKDQSLDIYMFPRTIKRLKANNKTEILFTDTDMVDCHYSEYYHCWIGLSRKGLVWIKDSEHYYFRYFQVLRNLDNTHTVRTDDIGRIWFSFPGGLMELQNAADSIGFVHLPSLSDPHRIKSLNGVVYADASGITLLSLDGRGYSYLNRVSASYSYFNSTELEIPLTWDILPLDKHNEQLYLATSEGLMNLKRKGNTILEKELLTPEKNHRYVFTSLVSMGNNLLLAGTFNQGLWLYNYKIKNFSRVNTISHKRIIRIKSIGQDSFLIFHDMGLVLAQLKHHELHTLKEIYALTAFDGIFDAAGRFWLNTANGILVLNADLDPLTKLNQQINKTGVLPAKIVLSTWTKTGRKIYTGTMGGGLVSIDPLTLSCQKINLPGNPSNIYAFKEVTDSILLMTTSTGIMLLNLNSNIASRLSVQNGFPCNDFTQAQILDNGAEFWFSGETGLIVIPRKHIHTLIRQPQEPVFRYKGIPVEQLRIEGSDRSINITPTLKQVSAFPFAEFSYRLLPIEDSLHTLSNSQSEISYNSVAPGNYLMELQLKDPSGVLRESVKFLPVTILPFWYETLWFKTAILLLVLAILIFIVRYFSMLRIERKLKKLEEEDKLNRERLRISRELHDNVGSQLSYLITGLETSELYLEKNRKTDAEQQIQELQNAARESISQLRDAIWALNREEMMLSHLHKKTETWIHKHCAPYPSLSAFISFNYTDDFPIDPLSALNLFRIIQEFTHNTLKYANATEIRINLKQEQKLLKLNLTDNGIGFKPDTNTGNGLGIMQDRANEIGAELSIQSSPGHGCSLFLQLELG